MLKIRNWHAHITELKSVWAGCVLDTHMHAVFAPSLNVLCMQICSHRRSQGSSSVACRTCHNNDTLRHVPAAAVAAMAPHIQPQPFLHTSCCNVGHCCLQVHTPPHLHHLAGQGECDCGVLYLQPGYDAVGPSHPSSSNAAHPGPSAGPAAHTAAVRHDLYRGRHVPLPTREHPEGAAELASTTCSAGNFHAQRRRSCRGQQQQRWRQPTCAAAGAAAGYVSAHAGAAAEGVRAAVYGVWLVAGLPVLRAAGSGLCAGLAIHPTHVPGGHRHSEVAQTTAAAAGVALSRLHTLGLQLAPLFTIPGRPQSRVAAYACIVLLAACQAGNKVDAVLDCCVVLFRAKSLCGCKQFST